MPRGTGLRRILSQQASGPAATRERDERCEMCGESISQEHSHLVDLDGRTLMCTCRGCFLLFTNPGAGRGRYRPVPDRYLSDPNLALTDADWAELQIPVRLAFFFFSSAVSRVVAFYPSPAGATESLLSLDAWETGLGRSALAALLEPDVEALIVRGDHGRYAVHLVPVDACYELVGLVRMHWKGFDGGEEAWAAIDAFFARIDGRSKLL
jgi:hypothetical protein